MRGCIAALGLVAALSSACATTAFDEIEETLDTCGQICVGACALIVLSPAIVACGVGFVHGACTRCGEGPPPDDDPPADDEAAASAELPAPPTMASAAMGY